MDSRWFPRSRPAPGGPKGRGARVRRRFATGRAGRALALLLALVLLGTAAVVGVRTLRSPEGTRITAWFDRTIGVHEGSDVRVLGVRVGSVRRIEPRGERVKVTLRVRDGVPVPAMVRAVVVSPSVVSGRFVQLSPAYGGGPRMPDGGVVPARRTATPLEIDELLQSLTDLSDALGPEGADKDGALSRLLDVGAENLDGNGKAIGDTVRQLGGAAKVLDDSSGDLVGTIRQLQKFTTMLKRNDGGVRKAVTQLSDVAVFLSEDRGHLAAALKELGTALGKVKTFVRDNRRRLGSNVDKLAALTRTVVKQRASVAEALDTLPLAASNVENAYNKRTRTIDGRVNINELRAGAREQRKDRSALPLPPVGGVYGTPPRAAGGAKGAGR
ncbi:MCE family protein [Streptomyces boncukensis]|uniref:MCE family protein n=1 Tax=Streptomyces boncukensis TaxID=2711219 RepID=A0A6G4X2X2_9ACTN|nr:MCE family protein [Streptomyces boncukensis]NGO71197.1 MCE family protein [Streptomyces boncukensis]